MWRQIYITFVIASFSLVGSVQAAELLSGSKGRVIGQYIVVLKGGSPAAVASSHRVVPSHLYQHALRGFAATVPDAALKRLLKDPNVDYIEPDGRVWAIAPGGNPDRGKPPKDDGNVEPPPSSQVTPWGVDRVGGPQVGDGLTAWVIDTGIDYDHPDLNVDTSRAANFVSRGKNTADDGNGHGTHVAGTIAALNNGIDVVGVAAGATVIPVRVLDNSGSGFYSWVIAGIDHVAANGDVGDVANMSLGGGASASVDQAVINAAGKGILFALAAGNDSSHAGNSSPARAEHANIFTVSAIDSSDNFAWFSNYGNPPVDVAAPGVSILSTARGGGTKTLSGTSMAAPHVAGLLLLKGTSLPKDGVANNDPDSFPDPIAVY
jgi:subtilisin family serine protease